MRGFHRDHAVPVRRQSRKRWLEPGSMKYPAQAFVCCGVVTP